MPAPLEKPAAYSRLGSADTYGTVAEPVGYAVVARVSRSRSTNSRSRVGKALSDCLKWTHWSGRRASASGNTSR